MGTAVGALGALALPAAHALAASTVTYNPSSFGSFVSVTGEANQDFVDISVSGNTIAIADSGPGGITTADPDCVVINPNLVACPLDPPDPPPPADPTGPVTSGSANLLGASDAFSSSAPFNVGVSGGEGEETLSGGPENDNLDGGSGNDTLLGGEGDDTLFGGGTAFTTGGNDLLDGQGGVDIASFNRELAVNVSLDGQPNDGFAGETDNAIVERANGGDGDDVLTGDAQANFLDGNEGDDLLTGLEGNDTLDGDDGDDGLVGGPQRDQFECDDNFDTGIVDPRDVVDAECERTGAEPGNGTASVNKKRRAKVPLTCPVEEANTCAGTLVLLAGPKQLGSGAFSVGAGATGRVGVKLTKQGAKALAKSGGTLLVTAQAQTTEPIGTSVHEDEVLLRSKKGGR